MASLSDYIEGHIKLLLRSAEDGWVELQRRELAQRFRCAPSQINYVLSTRFTLEKGYLVQSRRGGGGYIRVCRIKVNPQKEAVEAVASELGDAIDLRSAEQLIERLVNMGAITSTDASLISAAVLDHGRADAPLEDVIRARALKAVIRFVLIQSPLE